MQTLLQASAILTPAKEGHIFQPGFILEIDREQFTPLLKDTLK
jgi:hypothetical protein